MLFIIGGKGWKEKSLTQFAWLTIRKKAFGQLSKYDLESVTHKCEISQGEEALQNKVTLWILGEAQGRQWIF